jgi:hypothetical protein
MSGMVTLPRSLVANFENFEIGSSKFRELYFLCVLIGIHGLCICAKFL